MLSPQRAGNAETCANYGNGKPSLGRLTQILTVFEPGCRTSAYVIVRFPQCLEFTCWIKGSEAQVN
jgi:hypothetical protein